MENLELGPGEEAWYRGVNRSSLSLLPSLFWHAAKLTTRQLDAYEANLFFEFQARARELHERGLSDWDVLFFMRHHGVPTRLLDWTDSFGTALYFALDGMPSSVDDPPCVWVMNPYALNQESWNGRDLVQPKYIGYVKGDFWPYGELLINSRDAWPNDKPVAIYPLQMSERMRAQRGWFALFGNKRTPLDQQQPSCLARLVLHPAAISHGREFLEMAGLKSYAIFPDLDHLSEEVLQANQAWLDAGPQRDTAPRGRKRRRTR